MVRRKLVREQVGGEPYDFYPLGKHVVSAPAVCRGRPTFKYTRVEVAGVLERMRAGHSIDEIVAGFAGRIPRRAVEEALTLAARALVGQAKERARAT